MYIYYGIARLHTLFKDKEILYEYKYISMYIYYGIARLHTLFNNQLINAGMQTHTCTKYSWFYETDSHGALKAEHIVEDDMSSFQRSQTMRLHTRLLSRTIQYIQYFHYFTNI